MNDGDISLDAVAPEILHRTTPLRFRALRKLCKEHDELSYERIMNAIRVSFKSTPHVQMVLRISLTRVIVVWKHPYNTQGLGRVELELKGALLKTIKQSALTSTTKKRHG